MDTIYISKYNEAFIEIDCEQHIAAELNDYFRFFVPNAQHTPKYKNKVWDGYIYLFKYRQRILYFGLLEYVLKFAKDRDIEVVCDSDLDVTAEFSVKEAVDFTKSLNLSLTPHEHQVMGLIKSIRRKRKLLLSPTASGKSLIIYMIARYRIDTNILILVPTKGLVSQLYGDFEDYSKNDPNFDVEENTHMIIGGKEKTTDKPITISTWQSIYKLPESHFQKIDTVIGDEAHLFTANSLKSIMEKCTNADYRIGLTGTLDGTKTHKLVLEGLFGKVSQLTNTKKLMDKKLVSDLKIQAIVLKYNDEIGSKVCHYKYKDEVNFLIEHEPRNQFIKNLALSLKGNSIVMFRRKEHGKALFESIQKEAGERKVFFIDGDTSVQDREDFRSIIEGENDAILVASLGTTGTGTNIRNLHNIIAGHPSKSRIANLQAIGRSLRKSKSKEIATYFDIADDFSRGYKKKNTTLNHFKERLDIYNKENFNIKIYKVKLNE